MRRHFWRLLAATGAMVWAAGATAQVEIEVDTFLARFAKAAAAERMPGFKLEECENYGANLKCSAAHLPAEIQFVMNRNDRDSSEFGNIQINIDGARHPNPTALFARATALCRATATALADKPVSAKEISSGFAAAKRNGAWVRRIGKAEIRLTQDDAYPIGVCRVTPMAALPAPPGPAGPPPSPEDLDIALNPAKNEGKTVTIKDMGCTRDTIEIVACQKRLPGRRIEIYTETLDSTTKPDVATTLSKKCDEDEDISHPDCRFDVVATVIKATPLETKTEQGRKVIITTYNADKIKLEQRP